MRDPYLQKILDGLAGELDPSEFEDCMGRLLLPLYTSLVPIRGGSDAGMDFAAKSAEGKDFPLLVTTAENVERNLKESLESFVRHGLSASQVGLVTSQDLTPPRRRELRNQARDLGFQLLETDLHHRWSLANRLYRNSDLVKELLEITGKPSALSALPRAGHLLAELELLARQEDLEWLRTTPGDLVLVGQPGSGKTALLLKLVREGSALFLASKDEGEIANAYRDLQPELILVDDAHADLELLARLRGIRGEIQASFRIIASTWPGTEEEVIQALGGTASCKTRQLELLTRAEIVEVLRALGVNEPDDDPYLRLLVDQAANKPGLAVVLGKLWLQGEWREVLTGQAVRKELIPKLKRLLGHDPTEILACFALGGEAGMSMDEVQNFLGGELGEFRRRTAQASHGGVLSTLGDSRLRVEPEILRSALLEEVFFKPPALPWRRLLDRVPSREAAVEALAAAAWRGVAVPPADLRTLLLEVGSAEAWRAFALTGQAEATWVLENFPHQITGVARQLLQVIPNETCRRLLVDAESDSRSPDTHRDHPLSVIRDWIRDIPASRQYAEPLNESLRRRRLLVDATTRARTEASDPKTLLQAALLALTAKLETEGVDATGATLITHRDALPPGAASAILELWKRIVASMTEITPIAWQSLEDSLYSWAMHGDNSTEATTSGIDDLRQLPAKILRDIASLGSLSPGLVTSLWHWSRRLGFRLELPLNPTLTMLFPPPVEDESRLGLWDIQQQLAREVGDVWSRSTREEVATELALLKEGTRWLRSGPNWLPELLEVLVNHLPKPEEWLDFFLTLDGDSALARELLSRTVREQRPGWSEALLRSLDNASLTQTAVLLTLEMQDPPEIILSEALRRGNAATVERACRRGRVALSTSLRLLSHCDTNIVCGAIVGEWSATPRGRPRAELSQEWRLAFLSVSAKDLESSSELTTQRFQFGMVLESDHELAEKWILAQMEQRPASVVPRSDERSLLASATRHLDQAQRKRLIGTMVPSSFTRAILPMLVRDSPELFSSLLSRSELRDLHLIVLAGKPPDEKWGQLAMLALAEGHSPSSVAAEALNRGFGEGHWLRWKKGFEDLLTSVDPRLREMAQHGIAMTDENIRTTAAERRKYELTGRF